MKLLCFRATALPCEDEGDNQQAEKLVKYCKAFVLPAASIDVKENLDWHSNHNKLLRSVRDPLRKKLACEFPSRFDNWFDWFIDENNFAFMCVRAEFITGFKIKDAISIHHFGLAVSNDDNFMSHSCCARSVFGSLPEMKNLQQYFLARISLLAFDVFPIKAPVAIISCWQKIFSCCSAYRESSDSNLNRKCKFRTLSKLILITFTCMNAVASQKLWTRTSSVRYQTHRF